MIEIIGNAPDWQTFAKAAAATGQTDARGHPLTGSPLANGGSWFYNAVGVVYQPTGATTTDAFGNTVPVLAALPGVWVRLRVNGDAPDLPSMIAVWKANGITVYQRGATLGWTSDGVNAAPAYVDTIGVIA